jgi:hypothetical protein
LPPAGAPGRALWSGLRSRAARFCVTPPAPPDEGLTALLVAVHDLLASCHPDRQDWLGHTTRVLRAHAAALLASAPPEDLPEVLSRHAVVEACLCATRVDTRVTWWSGQATFAGRSPERRLLRWGKVRRVQQETSRVPVARLGLAEGRSRARTARRSLLDALFTASPLTPLAACMEDALPVPLDLRQPLADGTPTFASLALVDHATLRGALCDLALATAFPAAAATWSAGVNALLSSPSPPPGAVVRALRMTTTLHQRRLYAAHLARQGNPGARGPLSDLLAGREPVDTPASRLTYALWLACRAFAPALSLPGREPELEPLALEVDRAVGGASLADQTKSLVRAIHARLG